MKEHQIRHQLTKQFNVDFPLEIVENEEGKQVIEKKAFVKLNDSESNIFIIDFDRLNLALVVLC